MSNPARYNFTLVRGDTFADVWTIKDSDGNVIDLSGGSAKFEVNEEEDGSGSALLAANESDWIALASNGTMTFSIPAASTAALSFDTAYYDAEVTIGGTTETILYGDVTLHKDIA